MKNSVRRHGGIWTAKVVHIEDLRALREARAALARLSSEIDLERAGAEAPRNRSVEPVDCWRDPPDDQD